MIRQTAVGLPDLILERDVHFMNVSHCGAISRFLAKGFSFAYSGICAFEGQLWGTKEKSVAR